MTILLVDDDAAIRGLLTKRLNSKGYGVLTACDGMEGVAVWSRHWIDLILSDYQMPNMDGVKMAAEIRQRKPAQWIILMTGNPAEAQRDLEARGISDVRILSKPFDYKDLEEAMK